MSEASEAVKQINDTLFNSKYHYYDYFSYLECIETPIGEYVKYCGHFIWDSENDYRDSVDGELEDLKDYLIHEIQKFAYSLKNSYKALS